MIFPLTYGFSLYVILKIELTRFHGKERSDMLISEMNFIHDALYCVILDV